MAGAIELLLLAMATSGASPGMPVRTSPQSVTSSTTLVNDNTLFIPMPAGTSWFYAGFLSVTGAAIGTGDIKVALTGPSGATGLVEAFGFNTSAAGPLSGSPVRGLGSAITVGVNGGSASPVILIGSVTIGATPGNLQLQFAQNSSSATSTTVGTGSILAAWPTPASGIP
jgi:hypothetical protein